MKKIVVVLFIIMVAVFSVDAQRVWVWYDSINMASIVGTDTVLQPQNKDNLIGGGVGSYGYTLTVDCEQLDANDAVISVGGNGMLLRGSNKYWGFEKRDSVILDKTALTEIVKNGGITDTTYTQTWIEDMFNFEVPMFKITPTSVTSGYLRWRWVFNKQ